MDPQGLKNLENSEISKDPEGFENLEYSENAKDIEVCPENSDDSENVKAHKDSKDMLNSSSPKVLKMLEIYSNCKHLKDPTKYHNLNFLRLSK